MDIIYPSSPQAIASRELKETPNFSSKLRAVLMKTLSLLLGFCFLSLFVYGNEITAHQDSSLLDTVRKTYNTVYRDKTTGWYLVEKDAQWGYLDENFEVIVEPKYERACSFREGLASVQRNGKWGWINQRGEEVIKPIYENAGVFDNGLAIAELGGKWGWIDAKGMIAVNFEYEWVMAFRNDGRAAVKKGNKWGWIDTKGNTVIAIQFDKIDGYEEGLVRVTKGTNTFYIDKFGRCVEDCYHEQAATASR
jgi:WG containing repeat